MKKYIISNIKQQIEAKKEEWAKNYVAKAYQSTLKTPNAMSQVKSADINMKLCEGTIKFLNDLLKSENSSKEA